MLIDILNWPMASGHQVTQKGATLAVQMRGGGISRAIRILLKKGAFGTDWVP